MIKRLFLVFALLSGLYVPSAWAVPLIADMSLRTIQIDSGFNGTDVLFFGARIDAGDVVLVVRGPKRNYTVRKKERMAGIWVNKHQVTFDGIDGFYAIASSRPLAELQNDQLLEVLDIGIKNLEFTHAKVPETDITEFEQALLSKKQNEMLFRPTVEQISFVGDTLFRGMIHFPENIPRGTYLAEAYLLSDGQLKGVQTTPMLVYKTGMDAVIFDFAHNHPAMYGALAIVLALTAGWGAGSIFRRI